MEFPFTLKYRIAENESDPDALVEKLGEAGCTDALVGIGQAGWLALAFVREADSAFEAVRSALADLKQAVPTAELVEAVPGQGSRRLSGELARELEPLVAGLGFAGNTGSG